VKMLLKPYSFQRLFSTVKNILDTTDSGSDGLRLPSEPTLPLYP
jgi:hypothetical protein